MNSSPEKQPDADPEAEADAPEAASEDDAVEEERPGQVVRSFTMPGQGVIG